MTKKTLTHDEKLMWLAEREVDCLGCHGSGEYEYSLSGIPNASRPCEVCGGHFNLVGIYTLGTGKVPKFPMLSRPFTGEGKTLVDNAETTVEAILSAGYCISIETYKKNIVVGVDKGRCWGEGRNPILNEALVSALYKGEREEKP